MAAMRETLAATREAGQDAAIEVYLALKGQKKEGLLQTLENIS